MSENEIVKPVNVNDLEQQEYSEGRRFGGKFKVLSDTHEGKAKIGIMVEELAPGKQSCPSHYHLREEEHILILEGEATLRLGKETYLLQKDHYIRFPAGQKAGHFLFNDSQAVCKFLVIGDHTSDDVIIYPDSDKVMVKATSEIYDRSQLMGYWDREETD